ncbi:unnamed protein product [Arctogadus glacialis]
MIKKAKISGAALSLPSQSQSHCLLPAPHSRGANDGDLPVHLAPRPASPVSGGSPSPPPGCSTDGDSRGKTTR